MNYRRKDYFIIFALAAILTLAVCVVIVGVTQSAVNATGDDTIILFLNDGFRYEGIASWQSYLVYGGREVTGAAYFNYYLITWVSVDSGCDRVYISTGSIVSFGSLGFYKVTELTNDKVVFTKQ